MLWLKDIKKAYKVGDIVTVALDGITVAFRDQEFVSVLGKSGSGKTTALNIIGGLDRYDSGNLIIKGKPTKDFKDKDWDAYRNNSVGFVFQSYNLIHHLTIVDNVELGMTLSGVKGKEKKQRALDVLERVGLKDHVHKKPNQLSGGQQQRVAIARALVNDPEILLCDEPTGALDTTTSKEVMDIIRNEAKDRLVIMVTHNPDLAHTYSDRIIEFEDGKIISDSNPYDESPDSLSFKLKHTKMSFFTALKLSFNNIRTKLGRTFLTSFASSIGIIGIAVILSLSSGFQKQIDAFQTDALSEYPIIISQSAVNLSEEALRESQGNQNNGEVGDQLYVFDASESTIVHQNNFDDAFLDFVSQMSPADVSSIGYGYLMNLNVIRKATDGYQTVSLGSSASGGVGGGGLSTFPIQHNQETQSFFERSYDLLSGSFPSTYTDMVLVVDSQNRIDVSLLESLGLPSDVETMDYDDIVGLEMTWVPNDAFYEETAVGTFVPRQNLEAMSDAQGAINLRVSGIVRLQEGSAINLLSSGLVYSDELSKVILENSMDSQIVAAQMSKNTSVFTLQPLTDEEKEQTLQLIGGSNKPFMITIYPTDFQATDRISQSIDEFNRGRSQDNVIVYTNLADTITSLTRNIMDGITIVLIAFASISLVVSLIMISIITYTSVLERTKEIGILKALGARKKDITRVFDAETFILGVFSGVLGITIAYLITIPVNALIYQMAGLNNVAQLNPVYAIYLIILSTTLTVLGGHIPARMASKRDAVIALRSE
ncbi:sulfate ABC transporter ATP-binding protein [Erysipelothrix larvae]|uniref:Sulfate ABC transporter ATP-binding protein n=1 Tax=Erysipelothrix larvae TaxID=1514105 RepID=A0A0X8H1K7_9FIRM|nr:ABC transporter ATP-binding protein/permease [Erysipelothrix larvae]AMC94340.1 sulfate ABC transporter ATP-binding protein [Erysipelothrix larvae]